MKEKQLAALEDLDALKLMKKLGSTKKTAHEAIRASESSLKMIHYAGTKNHPDEALYSHETKSLFVDQTRTWWCSVQKIAVVNMTNIQKAKLVAKQ